ncbi:MAG TPA: 2-phosphosulfolactate phosphatase [Ktedonobacteraceae bacterium]
MYTQHPYRCRFDWGRYGVRQAAERGDILVIVDTLRFSTTTITAVDAGGFIYPCPLEEDATILAQQIGGEAAVSRYDGSQRGRFSLSHATYLHLEPGTRIVLSSPNGATCSRYASQVPFLFVGALVNAKAVATIVSSLLEHQELSVTVIACGERWKTPSEDGELRVALEDYLGAGAILSYLPQEKSPEALVCAGAFVQVQNDLLSILWECGSGRELREKGFGMDVQHAARLNVYETVPHMRDNCFEPFDTRQRH